MRKDFLIFSTIFLVFFTSFNTQFTKANDVSPPEILTLPVSENGVYGSITDENMEFSFSEPIDVSKSEIYLNDTKLDDCIMWSWDKQSFYILLSLAPLEYDTNYSVKLKNFYGLNLNKMDDFTLNFKTLKNSQNEEDTIPPYITKYPFDESLKFNFSNETDLVFEFSEEIDISSMSALLNGQQKAQTAYIDSFSNNRFRFLVSDLNLSYNTSYTFILSNIKDLNSNSSENITFSFQTIPDETLTPKVISHSPQGSNIFISTNKISIQFDKPMDTIYGDVFLDDQKLKNSILWFDNNTKCEIDLPKLAYEKQYSVSLNSFQSIDGGVFSQPFVFTFNTQDKQKQALLTLENFSDVLTFEQDNKLFKLVGGSSDGEVSLDFTEGTDNALINFSKDTGLISIVPLKTGIVKFEITKQGDDDYSSEKAVFALEIAKGNPILKQLPIVRSKNIFTQGLKTDAINIEGGLFETSSFKPIDGSIRWQNPNYELVEGENILQFVFEPKDSLNFNSYVGEVKLVAEQNKVNNPPEIIDTTPFDILKLKTHIFEATQFAKDFDGDFLNITNVLGVPSSLNCKIEDGKLVLTPTTSGMFNFTVQITDGFSIVSTEVSIIVSDSIYNGIDISKKYILLNKGFEEEVFAQIFGFNINEDDISWSLSEDGFVMLSKNKGSKITLKVNENAVFTDCKKVILKASLGEFSQEVVIELKNELSNDVVAKLLDSKVLINKNSLLPTFINTKITGISNIKSISIFDEKNNELNDYFDVSIKDYGNISILAKNKAKSMKNLKLKLNLQNSQVIEFENRLSIDVVSKKLDFKISNVTLDLFAQEGQDVLLSCKEKGVIKEIKSDFVYLKDGKLFLKENAISGTFKIKAYVEFLEYGILEKDFTVKIVENVPKLSIYPNKINLSGSSSAVVSLKASKNISLSSLNIEKIYGSDGIDISNFDGNYFNVNSKNFGSGFIFVTFKNTKSIAKIPINITNTVVKKPTIKTLPPITINANTTGEVFRFYTDTNPSNLELSLLKHEGAPDYLNLTFENGIIKGFIDKSNKATVSNSKITLYFSNDLKTSFNLKVVNLFPVADVSFSKTYDVLSQNFVSGKIRLLNTDKNIEKVVVLNSLNLEDISNAFKVVYFNNSLLNVSIKDYSHIKLGENSFYVMCILSDGNVVVSKEQKINLVQKMLYAYSNKNSVKFSNGLSSEDIILNCYSYKPLEIKYAYISNNDLFELKRKNSDEWYISLKDSSHVNKIDFKKISLTINVYPKELCKDGKPIENAKPATVKISLY